MQGLDYFLPEEAAFDAQELPAGFENGYVAVAVGAQHATKRIPMEKIVDIGNLLFKPIVLLGDSKDSKVGDDIVAQLYKNKTVINSINYALHLSFENEIDKSILKNGE